MKNPKSISLILLVAIAVICGRSLHAQDQRDQQIERMARQRQEALKKLDAEFPIVDFTAPEPTEPAARVNREAKSKRHNASLRHIGPGMDSFEIHHWPSDFSAIPVRLSNAIIICEVSDAKAYLSSDKSNVYSEFKVTVKEVFKDDTGKIHADSAIQVERRGGRVLFPSGLISRFIVAGLGMPQVGNRYVLFLTRVDQQEIQEPIFEILTAYHLQAGRVIPLDDSPYFEEYRGADEMTLLNEIWESIGSS